MPEAVILTATKGFGVFMSSVLALVMSVVVHGVPACQDPRVGQRDSRRGGPRGWGQGRRGVRVLNPEGAGERAGRSQLNGWRMKRRALGGDVTREGFFHTMAKGIIVLRRPRCGSEASPRQDW